MSPFIELGVGFNPELTARDNVVVNAALLGMPRAEALARFPRDHPVRRAGAVRGPEAQELLVRDAGAARLRPAIQADADVYIVDEVLAVGDARFQEKCFDTFRRLKRDGHTVIYVTHDLGTVERFCDRARAAGGRPAGRRRRPARRDPDYRQHDIELAQAGQATHEQTLEPAGATARPRSSTPGSRMRRACGRTPCPQGEQVTFCASIRFTQPMEHPVFGLIVRKNEARQHVFVTNTMFDGVATGSFQPGEETVYRVAFRVDLAHGRHTASPAVAYQDAQRFADWREDFAGLMVSGGRYSGGIVDLPHETTVERPG